MIASEEKSRLFLNAIREHLEARQKDIEDEIAAVRRQERENAEAEAAALSEEYIRLESEAIRAQANRDSAQLETALRAELAAERRASRKRCLTPLARSSKRLQKPRHTGTFCCAARRTSVATTRTNPSPSISCPRTSLRARPFWPCSAATARSKKTQVSLSAAVRPQVPIRRCALTIPWMLAWMASNRSFMSFRAFRRNCSLSQTRAK